MARHIYQGTAQDGTGRVIGGATVTVYLAGTTTLATIYAAATGAADADSAVSTDDTYGTFSFFVDNTDYKPTQLFKVVISKSNYTALTFDNIRIFDASALPLDAKETKTTGTVTLNHWGITDLAAVGAITATLPDGTDMGQMKLIVMSVAVASTVSITHHATSDPEVATFDAIDEYWLGIWTGTEWATVSNTCTFV